jgi:O-phosphoseryl-tRNA(Cys) synthetase
VHQDGKYGSIGYRYPWSGDESLRLVLRTHTTAVSANMLHQLAGVKGPDGRPPAARYFSIDRVFRNESVDATHLAEFHQVEGVIADYNLSMGELLEVSMLVLTSSYLYLLVVAYRLTVTVHEHLLRQDGHHQSQVQAGIQPLSVTPVTFCQRLGYPRGEQ